MYSKNKSMDFCKTGVMKDYGKMPLKNEEEDTRSTLTKVGQAAKAFAYGSNHSITRGVRNAIDAYKGPKKKTEENKK